MQKETKAERERKFQEQYDRNIAAAERSRWPVTLLFLTLFFGGCGYIGFLVFHHQLAAAFPEWIKEAPGAEAANGSGDNGGGSGIKLGALPETVSEGAIGDQLLKDDVILSVVDTKSIDLSQRGVAIYVVSAIIGNGGKKPMNCPAVEGVMYDTEDRQYAALQREGQYSIGQALNPLLCLDQRWAFIVPEGVTFKRFELTLPSHNIITVDLTRRTPQNQLKLVAGERERMRAAQEAFASRLADIEDRKNREQKNKTDAINAVVIKTSASRSDIAAKLDAAMEKKTATEKNIQKLQKRIKSVENLVSTGLTAVDKWTVALKKAKAELEEVLREYNNSNGHDRMRLESPLAKAKDNVDLQDRRLTDATQDLSDRKVKLNDANLELTQENRNFTTAVNDIARLNTELDTLDNTLQENQKKLEDLKPKTTDAAELPPDASGTAQSKTLPPPPPPPDPGDGEQK